MKPIYKILLTVSFIIIIVNGVLIALSLKRISDENGVPATTESDPALTVKSETAFTEPDTTLDEPDTTLDEPDTDVDESFETSQETEPQYVSPINFDELREKNPDIIGWLSIPDTVVYYPIVRREGDDKFYLNHNADGNSYVGGALFVESAYNGSDFTDPVTIIYGHYMRSGMLFGSLQKDFSGKKAMDSHSEIIVYLEDRELHYNVFAAVPYDTRHILYNYDFSNKRIFGAFFQSIFDIRSLDSTLDLEKYSESEGNVLILSTCLSGNSDNRFLVMGRLSEENS